jgi:hypothetical protein
MDAIVREDADAMNVLAKDLRAAVARALGVCRELGATLEDAQEAVVSKPSSK